ncbi:hypothetical protein [Streptomyces sp. NPDC059949]|uniref:hypothetical protein n=1 Tax=Streptomyces sp. NPDC059949 TaxID=3347013 RepID=UPI0036585359
MNFEDMPELKRACGYPFVILLMAVVCVSLYVIFKKRSPWWGGGIRRRLHSSPRGVMGSGGGGAGRMPSACRALWRLGCHLPVGTRMDECGCRQVVRLVPQAVARLPGPP